MTEIIKIPSKEDFYDKVDSLYIRLEFKEPMGVRSTLRNEMLIHSDANTENAEFLAIIGRGLVEILYGSAQNVYNIGKQALFHDMIEASGDELPEDQREIWYGPTLGGIN